MRAVGWWAVAFAGYWLGRGYWRAADVLEKVPGFIQGFEDAYKLNAEREEAGPWER